MHRELRLVFENGRSYADPGTSLRLPPRPHSPFEVGIDFDPKRRRILQRAAQAFVLQGYTESRLEDIAIEAGVGKPTLYRYFSNKEDLLRSVMLASLEELIVGSHVLLDPDQDLEKTLVGFASRMIAAMFAELSSSVTFHRISRLLYAINLSQPQLVEEITAIFKQEISEALIAYFVSLASGPNARLTVASDDEAAILATHFFQSVFFSCLAKPVAWKPDPASIDELARSRVKLFLYGAIGTR